MSTRAQDGSTSSDVSRRTTRSGLVRRPASRQEEEEDGDFPYRERGQTRSGRRFARLNAGYFPSLAQLLSSRWRLQELETAASDKIFPLSGGQGWLVQTTLRFSVHHTNLRQSLLRHFVQIFREHSEDRDAGFEVIVTFNAVLSNAEGTSFSVFYGHDYRAGNLSGAAPELGYGSTYLVRTLGDVARLPTTFDFERLAETHKHAFERSGVHICRFLNVVYLVFRYVSARRTRRRRQRQRL